MSTPALTDVPVGTRVTVRRRLPDGRAGDVVGHLVAHGPDRVTVSTRGGDVTVDLADVVAHRVVAAVPWRVATFLRRADLAVLDVDPADDVAPATLDALAALSVELVADGVPVVLLAPVDGGPHAALRPLLSADAGQGAPAVVRHGSRTRREDWASLRDELPSPAHGRPGLQLRVAGAAPRRLDAARQAGWQARLLTPPS